VPFEQMKQLVCLGCERPFVATVFTERRGRELVFETTPCPDCGGVGAVPIEVTTHA
jgi:RNase P subunit RPR2